MGKKDPRVDAYIAKSADFAKPILAHIRKIAHAACPEVEEAIKWGFPFYLYKGILLNTAAFKQHCSVGFWKAELIFGPEKLAPGSNSEGSSMGHLGRITAMKDLPSDKVLASYIKKAMKFNEAGTIPPSRTKPKDKVRPELVVPECLTAALKKNKKARETFENFSYSHKKEYIEWITEAKTDPTRDKRLATTIEWLTTGKSRNWKYQNC